MIFKETLRHDVVTLRNKNKGLNHDKKSMLCTMEVVLKTLESMNNNEEENKVRVKTATEILQKFVF